MAPDEAPTVALPADEAAALPLAQAATEPAAAAAPLADSVIAPRWWQRAATFVRGSLPRQIAAAAIVFGAIVTTGHIVGGFIGWWHLYELAFLKGQGKQAQSEAGRPPRLSIVVLPLAAEAGSPDAGPFGDVLTTDITNELGRLPGSFVISRDTAYTFKGKDADPRQIARELNVRYVVRGTVRRLGDDVRVQLALIDGRSGAQKWSEQFSVERASLASAVDDIGLRVSRALNVEVYRAEAQRAAALQPHQVEAEDVAMQGWAVWYRGLSRENVAEALRLFETAVARDSGSLRAWSGIALMTGTSISSGWATDPAAARARQREALTQLERIDANDMLTYMGRVGPFWWSADFEGLLRLTTTIVERFPNNPHGYHQLGSALLMLGRFDECAAPLRKAVRLGPRDTYLPYTYATLAMCRLFAGDTRDAVESARLAVQANAALAGPHLILAACLAQDGRAEEARSVVAAHAAHPAFRTDSLRRVLLGKDQRLIEQRERIVATLKEMGVP